MASPAPSEASRPARRRSPVGVRRGPQRECARRRADREPAGRRRRGRAPASTVSARLGLEVLGSSAPSMLVNVSSAPATTSSPLMDLTERYVDREARVRRGARERAGERARRADRGRRRAGDAHAAGRGLHRAATGQRDGRLMRPVFTPARGHRPPSGLPELIVVADARRRQSRQSLDRRQEHAGVAAGDVLDAYLLVRQSRPQGAADRRLSADRGWDAADVGERRGLRSRAASVVVWPCLSLPRILIAIPGSRRRAAPALVQSQLSVSWTPGRMRKRRGKLATTLAYGGGDLQ